MAGGMHSKRNGPTLAERSARSGIGADRTAGFKHCWVRGLPGDPGRWSGLLVEWIQRDGGWVGRVVYAVDDGDRAVLVEACVAAQHLQPAER